MIERITYGLYKKCIRLLLACFLLAGIGACLALGLGIHPIIGNQTVLAVYFVLNSKGIIDLWQ